MNRALRSLIPMFAGTLLLAAPSMAPAQTPTDKTPQSGSPGAEADIPSYSLLEASSKGLVSVDARGTDDGRMTVSVTNRTRRPLRVVLPPGIVAQSATGQFGGMGGMGGGMGGMGGGMGGMGGGMGGMGGGGMGGGTMPPMMGMMMLSRLIMYFCGDPESWDPRSMMMGMGMGGGMMGGMGGMGMGGGMGGGMMGGGMRSVPPSTLAYADLNPKQTRKLPTRLISLTAPDPQTGLSLPQKDEPLRLVGDVARVNDDPRVQKALRRLAAQKIPTSVSQLVMWRLSGGLEWDEIAQLAEKYGVKPYELTLARNFAEHLDALDEKSGETGSILFQIEGADANSEAIAAELTEVFKGKTVLGLQAKIGIPARPEGPSVACHVRLQSGGALVQVATSDGMARNWVTFGKFPLKTKGADGKLDAAKLADGVAEGIISRLVRAQILKEKARDKGKLVYLIRIDNVSPLILSGLALQSAAGKADAPSRVLTSLGIPPRKYLTLPASEDVVKAFGLRQGIRVSALDLSGL